MPSLLQPIPDPEEYGVSLRTGFLPPLPPLARLSDPYYEPWECIAQRLPALLLSGRLRKEIDALPVLNTERLFAEAEWQRACTVLGFFTHSYIWADEVPSESIPPTITIPFLEVAKHLEITPCAPYAVTNLFNWNTFTPGEDPSIPENLVTNMSYTGSSDESWFYLISVAMEGRGASVFPDLFDAMRAARIDRCDRVTTGLSALADCINDLSVLLRRMYEKCDPYVFYHVIRPFLAGSKNMAAAGLPRGVFYDEGNGKGEWRQYSGGSNAQSSLIQLFDAFLGVKHYAAGEGISKTSKAQAFITDMRFYMPGPHRRLLEAVESTSDIQSYSLGKPKGHPTREAYETAISALAELRSFHLQLVTRYIITPSRTRVPWQNKKHLNLATASSAEAKEAGERHCECKSSHTSTVGEPERAGESLQLHGTGGTTLLPFLRQCRDETMVAVKG